MSRKPPPALARRENDNQWSFPVPELLWPSIYKVDYGPGRAGPPRYRVVFDAEAVPHDLRDELGEPEGIQGYDRSRDRIGASSAFPPWVMEMEGRYADLKALFDEADVRNVPRDKLLHLLPATLTVQTFDFSKRQDGETTRVGRGLSLKGITISVENIQL